MMTSPLEDANTKLMDIKDKLLMVETDHYYSSSGLGYKREVYRDARVLLDDVQRILLAYIETIKHVRRERRQRYRANVKVRKLTEEKKI